MTPEKFREERQALLKELNAAKALVNDKYTMLANAFVEMSCPYKIEQVIEVTRDPHTNRTGKIRPSVSRRYAIFQIQVHFLTDDSLPALYLYGYWLNPDSGLCQEWNSNGLVISGVSNPFEVKLSDKQNFIRPKGVKPNKE